ncbi:SRPBCC family protein [Millisia brevis]|uniref:SRPBCC family protein n=1 Tax=Millisia brevis TaxID=264148 RepID=UPI000A03E5F6|nr:SRPBCC family protein [Millisia brevis]
MTPSAPQDATTPRDPARRMVAEVVIDASPEQVWTVLTDLRVLADASPELVTMVPLRPGGLRAGQRYVGINRRGVVFWPTLNRVDVVEAPQQLVWTTTTSASQWGFTLEPQGSGTRVVQTRTTSKPLGGFSALFSKVLLGGVGSHADELEDGMGTTLDHLRVVAEVGRTV